MVAIDGYAIGELARRTGMPAAAGVDPASAQAGAVVAAVSNEYAASAGLPDGPAARRRLLTRVETANDPRREHYLRLLAVVNGWPPAESAAPALDWFAGALRAALARP
jgi:hypothetical protein